MVIVHISVEAVTGILIAGTICWVSTLIYKANK